jgi:hypothetical protein
MLLVRRLWLHARLAWFVYALYGYTFVLHAHFLSRAAYACCGCMHAWLGFVYALYGYTLNSPICEFPAELHVR